MVGGGIEETVRSVSFLSSVLVHRWDCYWAGLGTSTNLSITIAFIVSAFWEL